MATSVSLAPYINQNFTVTAEYGKYPSGRPHSGLDLSATIKDPKLYSIIKGKLTKKVFSNVSYGNHIEITRNDGIRILYGHMKSIANINVGNTIEQGQYVGIEGTTGNSTGEHVHVEMWNSSGSNMNPASFMGIPNKFDNYSTKYIYNGKPLEGDRRRYTRQYRNL